MSGNIRVVFAYLGLLLIAGVCRGAEIHVPADIGTIQGAIQGASDGDTIIVSPGRYFESIDFLGKAITVRSTDPENPSIVDETVIDGGLTAACVTFKRGEHAASVLDGMCLTRGTAPRPYDMALAGGIYCVDSSPTIRRNAVRRNRAGYGSGIYCSNSDATIVGNRVEENTGGAAIYCSASSVLIDSNSIVSNASGIQLTGAESSVVTRNCIRGNYGAGVTGGGFQIVTDNTVVQNGSAGNYSIMAGGICLMAGLAQRNTVADNRSERAGGMMLEGAVQAEENIISGNQGKLAGGMVVGLFGGSLVSSNVIMDNAETGVLLSSREFSFVGNTVLGNRSNFNAGGVYISESLGEVSGNLIVGNRCSGRGGGIFIFGEYPQVFCNNVVIGNRADISGGGLCNAEHPVRVFNCAISQNRAPLGSQFATDGSASYTYLDNCDIQAGPDSIHADQDGPVTLGPGNIDADPLFVDPGHWDDHGTPDDASDDTFVLGDYHLLPGSPCIDAGTNDIDSPYTPEIETLPATDLAGITRVIDGNRDGCATVDMGAYEYLPGDVNYDGKVNILDLIFVRNSLGRDPASSPAARKADLNNDGKVNVLDIITARNGLQQ